MITGTVEQVGTNFGKFSVKIDDVWYGTKMEWAPNPQPEVGDTINFDPKGAKFLAKVKILEKGSGGGSSAPSTGKTATTVKSGHTGGRTFPVAPLAPERTINRQNALTAAVNFAVANKVNSPDEVIALAELFEAYTTGDRDLAQAEAAMSSDKAE